MKTQNNPKDHYKKLNTKTGSTRNSGTVSSGRIRSMKQPAAAVPKAAKGQKGQIALVISLALFCIVLIVLIILLLKPERTQFWQSIPGKSGDKTAVVKRLETTEPQTALPEEIQQPETGANTTPEKPEEVKTPESSRTRETRIYFVKVNAEGLISLKSVNRNIDFSNSPLTRTINSLIGGPLSDEINKGSLTLIPEGTRLLSARVEAGTAYLNFNEAFRFNPLGREGYLAQLKQIVYTSTEFPSIKNVQILIEGVIREYLGGEGFYIGEPLSRDSFKNSP